MKKALISVFLILSSFICLIAAAACGSKTPDTPTHTHNYAWVDNGDGTHKKHCSGIGCDNPDIEIGYHVYGNGVCVCGNKYEYKIELAYTYHSDGGGYYEVTGIGTVTDTDITIPSVYNGKPVTSIAGYAFLGRVNLTGVTIESGVESIGFGAFDGCSGLTSIVIPSSVTNIGENAFRYCDNITSATLPSTAISYITKSKLRTVIINGGEHIEDDAFEECGDLTSVEIGNSITRIGSHAFWRCGGLTDVTIGSGVTSIGIQAFSDCIGLTDIKIPSSVTRIENGAFAFSDNLIQTENGVQYVDNWAIRCDTSLSSATLRPDTVGLADYTF